MLRSECRFAITAMTGDAVGDQILERLLPVMYAYGINVGIRAVAAGDHGHREEQTSPPATSKTSGQQAPTPETIA